MNMQIYEEASEWIVLHRSDGLDADLRRRFDAWLRESPQHLRAYLEMSTIWEDVPVLHPEWNASASELIARAREDNIVPLTEVVPSMGAGGGIRVDLGTAQRADVEREQPSTRSPEVFEAHKTSKVADEESKATAQTLQALPITVPASSARIQLLAIAALLLVTVGISAWYYLQRGIYTTDIGEQRTIALSDGSTVELNAQTKIREAYTDNQRTIQLLRGQALFKVAKDAQRPFIVDSGETRIRAVGTQFDVYRKTAATQVTVVEGRVAVLARGRARTSNNDSPNASQADEPYPAVSPERETPESSLRRQVPREDAHVLQAHLGEVLLSAGEQLTVSASITATEELQAIQPVAVPEVANIEATTAWTEQRLLFNFTPLTEVAEEFNRYNRRPLVIEDPSLKDFNISGSFSSTDPTLLLRFLRSQPGIVVNETDDEIRISRQSTAG